MTENTQTKHNPQKANDIKKQNLNNNTLV